MDSTKMPAGTHEAKEQVKDVLGVLKKYKTLIDAQVARFYNEELKERDYTGKFYRKVHAEMQDFCLGGGKRLRPLLLLIGYIGYSKNNDDASIKKILPAAAAVEVLHSFLLVHDDIVDRDELRRGKPSMYKRIEQFMPKGITQPADMAIMAGDLMMFHAIKLLYQTEADAEKIVRAGRIMLNASINTGIGELYDLLDNNQSLTEAKHENVLFVMTYKTSRYTIQMPLAMGAVLAGSKLPEEHFEELANLLGVAFQLQDDLLGIFGTQEKFGKSIKSDVEEGKKTLIMKWLYDECTPSEKEFVLSKLGKPISDGDFEKMKKLIADKGIRQRVEKYISELLEESKEEIKNLKMNAEGEKYLLSIVDMLAGREE